VVLLKFFVEALEKLGVVDAVADRDVYWCKRSTLPKDRRQLAVEINHFIPSDLTTA